MITRTAVTFAFVLCLFKAGFPQTEPEIIPLPCQMQTGDRTIDLSIPVKINFTSETEARAAGFLSDFLETKHIDSKPAPVADADIVYQTLKIFDSLIGNEGYRIKTIDGKFLIQANTGAGLFYGTQTFIQVLPRQQHHKIRLQEIQIVDKPAFVWRGLMLDVARHILPLSYIRQVVDQMAFYKLNVLHLHLTDDQGWRIEIKRYPKLAEVASRRKETIVGWQPGIAEKDWVFDGTEYGGFYTREELKDLVDYAGKRNITIVPEIEMPGHSLALLSAYPELSCKEGTYKAATYWGVFDDIICPTEDAIRFLKNVLNEVCDIFPGTYIHIGGDEAPKTRWEESEYIRQLMNKYRIEHVEAVQGWFNRRIEEYLNSRGRRLIGWDEILDGGISPDATVMSWRGEAGGIKAATAGNDVVMSPGSAGMYWDHAQGPVEYEPDGIGRREGNAPWSKVYHYNPVPRELDVSKASHILGMQANLWSEYIKTPEASQYLTFPRIIALSEAAWSPVHLRNWENFLQRTPWHFQRLMDDGFRFRIPEPEVISIQEDKSHQLIVKLFTPVPGFRIRYSLEEKLPSGEWQDYDPKKGIIIQEGAGKTLRAVAVSNAGNTSAPFTRTF